MRQMTAEYAFSLYSYLFTLNALFASLNTVSFTKSKATYFCCFFFNFLSLHFYSVDSTKEYGAVSMLQKGKTHRSETTGRLFGCTKIKQGFCSEILWLVMYWLRTF